ncbi:MAG: transcriptional regulator NrdR [Candidatus Alcyoniella australis]|nr:transcriptional regulator NrdR [Candidatus Alcyoniella australis]
MRCPYCGSMDNKVLDSRYRRDGNVVRRRRECDKCLRRFTTYERVEEVLPLVIKKDGTRQAFDRKKLLSGVRRACEKRPVSIEEMEGLADRVEQHFQDLGEREIDSQAIGELVMQRLAELDKVAYVRFASVYRDFQDVNEFMEEIRGLLGEGGRGSDKAGS